MGEIGGQLEATEDAARWIKNNGTKPAVGFTGGQTALVQYGTMGHASSRILLVVLKTPVGKDEAYLASNVDITEA